MATAEARADFLAKLKSDDWWVIRPTDETRDLIIAEFTLLSKLLDSNSALKTTKDKQTARKGVVTFSIPDSGDGPSGGNSSEITPPLEQGDGPSGDSGFEIPPPMELAAPKQAASLEDAATQTSSVSKCLSCGHPISFEPLQGAFLRGRPGSPGARPSSRSTSPEGAHLVLATAVVAPFGDPIPSPARGHDGRHKLSSPQHFTSTRPLRGATRATGHSRIGTGGAGGAVGFSGSGNGTNRYVFSEDVDDTVILPFASAPTSPSPWKQSSPQQQQQNAPSSTEQHTRNGVGGGASEHILSDGRVRCEVPLGAAGAVLSRDLIAERAAKRTPGGMDVSDVSLGNSLQFNSLNPLASSGPLRALAGEVSKRLLPLPSMSPGSSAVLSADRVTFTTNGAETLDGGSGRTSQTDRGPGRNVWSSSSALQGPTHGAKRKPQIPPRKLVPTQPAAILASEAAKELMETEAEGRAYRSSVFLAGDEMTRVFTRQRL